MIGIKSILKLFSLMIITTASVVILTIFVNYIFDMRGIEHLLYNEMQETAFRMQLEMAQMVIYSSATSLAAVSAVVLLFSISQFINESSAELGVLKALGYSENRLALRFAKFGIAVLIGAGLGYLLAFALSPLFYDMIDGGGYLPVRLSFGFNYQTLLIMVVMPTVLFTLLSIFYAKFKLKKRPLELITGAKKTKPSKLNQKLQSKNSDRPFIKELRRNMLFSSIALIFFMALSGFGFGAQIQMAFSMQQVSQDVTMAMIFVVMGLVLGVVPMLLSLNFIMAKNRKHLAILKAYGYSEREISKAMFGGYRIVTYVGFAIGTAFQFMITMVVAGIYELDGGVSFHWIGFIIVLPTFILFFESLMFLYRWRISKVPLKEIMQS
ncbi:MAG: hypothetical protein FWC11_02715 [Firmicutes bacterium]|nr:hypothetical protein [Bacillota bacterium]MCL2255751.1 hypothetical protein [Bacillota bacterium]